MTFIEIVQKVSERVGYHGIGPASTSTTTYQRQIVAAVRDAWEDIQRHRINWKWMRNSKEFLMTIGKTEYSLTEIFGPSNGLRYWLKDAIYLEDPDGGVAKMFYMDYDHFILSHMNDTGNVRPYDFTIKPQDNSLIFASPDKVYTVRADYQKIPSEFANDASEPEMPEHFHRLIVYKALAIYASAIEFWSIHDKYDLLYSQGLGDLYREQLPEKKFKVRGIA